jgi:hypothetical protein
MRSIPSTTSYTFAIEATLLSHVGWGVSVTNDPDPIFTFTPPQIVKTRRSDGGKSWKRPTARHSVFAVRDALFKVDDVSSALALFNAYGPLRRHKSHSLEADNVSLSQIRLLRDWRRELLLRGSTRNDFRQGDHKGVDLSTVVTIVDAEAYESPAVRLEARRDGFIGVTESDDIREASRIAVYLDRLSGYGWAECEECRQPYKKTSKHKRKYCSPQCLSYVTTQTNLKPGVPPARRRKTTRRVSLNMFSLADRTTG